MVYGLGFYAIRLLNRGEIVVDFALSLIIRDRVSHEHRHHRTFLPKLFFSPAPLRRSAKGVQGYHGAAQATNDGISLFLSVVKNWQGRRCAKTWRSPHGVEARQDRNRPIAAIYTNLTTHAAGSAAGIVSAFEERSIAAERRRWARSCPRLPSFVGRRSSNRRLLDSAPRGGTRSGKGRQESAQAF